MINYHNKTFRSVNTSPNADVNEETVFIYRQDENVVTGSYAGGNVVAGHLIALMDEQGNLDMRYHHINNKDEIKTGKCLSRPEVQENGKIVLHEDWQWTCGDLSSGKSVIEEI